MRNRRAESSGVSSAIGSSRIRIRASRYSSPFSVQGAKFEASEKVILMESGACGMRAGARVLTVPAGQAGILAGHDRFEFAYERGTASTVTWCEGFLPEMSRAQLASASEPVGTVADTADMTDPCLRTLGGCECLSRRAGSGAVPACASGKAQPGGRSADPGPHPAGQADP